MEIGKIISKLRNDRGLTQRDLAEILGVSNGAIGMWETQKREPDLDTVKKMTSFFNVTADYLIGNQQIPLDNSKIKQITAKEEKLLNGFRELSEDDQEEFIKILDIKLQKNHKARGIGVKSSELTNTEKGSMVG